MCRKEGLFESCGVAEEVAPGKRLDGTCYESKRQHIKFLLFEGHTYPSDTPKDAHNTVERKWSELSSSGTATASSRSTSHCAFGSRAAGRNAQPGFGSSRT